MYTQLKQIKKVSKKVNAFAVVFIDVMRKLGLVEFSVLMFIEFLSQINFLFFKIIHTKHDVFVSAYHYDMKIAQ